MTSLEINGEIIKEEIKLLNQKSKLGVIEQKLKKLIYDQFPQLHILTRTKSDIKQEQHDPKFPKKIDTEACNIVHFVFNEIIKNLNTLSIELDPYKEDVDIFYFIENIKDQCKKLIKKVNFIGISNLKDSELREQYYQLEFKLMKILAFIEILMEKPKIKDIEDIEENANSFQEEIIQKIREEIKFYLDTTKNRFWRLGKDLTKSLYKYLLKTTKILSQFYFIIRSSNLNLRNFIIHAIFKTIYFIHQIRILLNRDTGNISTNPIDFMNLYSQHVVALFEVLGYITPYFQKKQKFELKIEPLKIIEIYVSKDCPYCDLFFKNKLLEEVQDAASALNVGVEIVDKEENLENKAAHFFYDINRTPTIKFPHLNNNYKLHQVLVYPDDQEGDSNFEFLQSIRKINSYLLGPSFNKIYFRHQNLEKLLILKEIFSKSPDQTMSLDSILKLLGMGQYIGRTFVQMLINKGILFAKDLFSVNIKKFGLDISKLEKEINNYIVNGD